MKKEHLFLELNSVLVKFWKEQGRPDKEIRIELLERMANWYKNMGTSTQDLVKQELPEDLNEAAGAYLDNHKPLTRYNWGDLMDAFKAGAEWMAKQGE